MNNSVFGKTIENLRKRVNIELVNNEKRLMKLTKSPSFEHFKIFTPDIAAVKRHKLFLCLNRPIYAGFTILELSKVLMYSLHYKYVKEKYKSQAKLLFTDTDSLTYEIITEDIYQDMATDASLFDFSDYPRDHFLYSTTNKIVRGKMKNETSGKVIEEFVGLRPKMHSLLYTKRDENNVEKKVEKKTAEGVAKYVTEQSIRHQHYKKCLLNKELHMTRNFTATIIIFFRSSSTKSV